MKPGPTLADKHGTARALALDKSCVNIQLQILERQRAVQTMAEESRKIMEWGEV